MFRAFLKIALYCGVHDPRMGRFNCAFQLLDDNAKTSELRIQEMKTLVHDLEKEVHALKSQLLYIQTESSTCYFMVNNVLFTAVLQCFVLLLYVFAWRIHRVLVQSCNQLVRRSINISVRMYNSWETATRKKRRSTSTRSRR